MKRMLLLALLAAVTLLPGCARRYVITLNNGARITTFGKPHLQGGSYIYKDPSGQPGRVSVGSVQDIAPASMVKEQKGPFLPQPSP